MTEYDFMEMQVAPPEGAICDLCSSPDVHWTFPCRDFQRKPEHATIVGLKTDGSLAVENMNLDLFSSGGWAACNPCHALILRGDRERLAVRSAKRMLKNNPVVARAWSFRDALAYVRRAHDQFWQHREGEPIHHNERPKEDPTR